MKSIGEIKAEKTSQVDELIASCSVFFAFSNAQFEENKTPLSEGDNYVSLGAGCYLPKSKLPSYLDGMKAIERNYKKAIKDNNQRKANILHELINQEAFYTGSLEETLEALGADYTREELAEVCHENQELYN